MPASRPAQPIRLYTALLSGHGHRARLFLSMLDLPFEIVPVDLAAGEHRQPEYLRLNPYGEVPTIVDGDVVLFDSNAILVYLAKRYGDASWLPDDPVKAAHVTRWLALAAGQIASGPCAARLVTVFKRDLDPTRAKAVAERLFTLLDAELSEKRFAVGDHPTIADVAAHTYIAHAPEGGVSLEPYPHLRAWLDRVAALPGFVPMPTTRAGLLAD